MSDLIAVKNGTTVFIEIKQPKGKLSDHQVKFEKEIHDHGGKYLVIRSFEDCREVFGR